MSTGSRDAEELEEMEVHPTLERLKILQQEHNEIETEFKREIHELNKKYRVKYDPLYRKRYDAMKDGDNTLPDFWLTAMRNHPMLNDMIKPADEPVLKYLEDIRCEWKEPEPSAGGSGGAVAVGGTPPAPTPAVGGTGEDPTSRKETTPEKPNPSASSAAHTEKGFALHFLFKEDNPYFGPPYELIKTYQLEESSDLTDPVLSHIESTDIPWKEGKDITKKSVTRKQKNKRTKQVRKTTEMVSCDSFFNFFKSQDIPTEDQLDELGEDGVDELEAEIESDYCAGTIIRDKIIPRAVDWYTGEAEVSDMETDEDEDGDSDDESDEDDDDNDSDDEDEDEDEDSKVKMMGGSAKKSAGGANKPDENCKQQ